MSKRAASPTPTKVTCGSLTVILDAPGATQPDQMDTAEGEYATWKLLSAVVTCGWPSGEKVTTVSVALGTQAPAPDFLFQVFKALAPMLPDVKILEIGGGDSVSKCITAGLDLRILYPQIQLFRVGDLGCFASSGLDGTPSFTATTNSTGPTEPTILISTKGSTQYNGRADGYAVLAWPITLH